MPTADFFARAGLLVVKNYLDAKACARLRREARSNARSQAKVLEKGAAFAIDTKVRRAHWVEVPTSTLSFVEARLMALKPCVEKHFHLALIGCEEPQFLVYKSGDFYQPHRDASTQPDAPKFLKERRVSVVIFLNGEANEPAGDFYGGGSL